MIHALVQGALVTDPAEKISAKGSRYATASVRVPTGDDSIFVAVIAFDTAAVDRLLSLAKGAGVCAAGELAMGSYTSREGETRTSWRLMATEILTVHQARRRRERSPA